jgi:hypothetical protein
MAAPSGSVTRITQKLVALRATMRPNTCPADLASISQGYIVISLGYEPAAPNEQLPLRYHLRAQEGIQNVHKDAVTVRMCTWQDMRSNSWTGLVFAGESPPIDRSLASTAS